MTSTDDLNQSLMDFIAKSPTPFHAIAQIKEQLETQGFSELKENEEWNLVPGSKNYIIRNDSSIIAFQTAQSKTLDQGFKIIGAHSDSPTLKIKAQAIKKTKNYISLGVEVYGGALLNPWFDRDLSLAGRIHYLDSQKKIQSTLIDYQRPVASIPSLAIHLDRNANEKRTINPQKHLAPLIMQVAEKDKSLTFEQLLIRELNNQKLIWNLEKILDHEILAYDTQKPAYIGHDQDFIAAARLDNLLSCYLALRALIDHQEEHNVMLCIHDHEEVGSVSYHGANGHFVSSILKRLCPHPEKQAQLIANSILFSCDNAHALHPNYVDKHDPEHQVMLNQGPVIKQNASQRYATNSETTALFSKLCLQEQVPFQKFVMRSDMSCGSTIGPLSSAQLGIKTIDIGVPTLGMHSIRELAGSHDTYYLLKVLKAFFNF